MKITIIILIVTLSICYADGQSDYFVPIDSLSTVDKSQGYSKSKLLYFHHRGCRPCKVMDKYVLSDQTVKEYLTENFDCYSVYGFEGVNKIIRELYDVKNSPCFLFLDSLGQPIHELRGSYRKEEFLTHASMHNTYNLQMLRSLYLNKPDDLDIQRNYIHAIDRAGRLDDKEIVKYLNAIPLDLISTGQKWFFDVIYYGSFRGKIRINTGGELHIKLRDLHDSETFPQYANALSTFLYFADHEELYTTSDIYNKNTHEIIRRLQRYETGNRILLKDLKDTSNIIAVFESRVPSLITYYEKLIDSGEPDQARKLLSRYHLQYKENSKVLNEIAWKIYTDQIKANTEIGLSIIEDALNVLRNYNNLDTYAHLLFKSENYSKARNIAKEAIAMAQKNNINSQETEALLQRIPK